MTNNKKFIYYWGKERQKGKGWFVLSKSLLMGIAIWVGSIAGMLIRGNLVYLNIDLHLIYFIGGFIGGLIATMYRWGKNEEKYLHLTIE